MMRLNWRHKTGLFLTLVAVGCGLFLECSAKQAAGITLLGIAFAWLTGSLTLRTLAVTFAILVCAVGLYVAVAPVWSDRESVRNSAAQYDSAIADLQSAVKHAEPIVDQPGAMVGKDSDPVVTTPDAVWTWMRSEEKPPRPGARYQFPPHTTNAEIMDYFESKLLLPRPTFSLGSSVRAHAWNVIGGLALFASGLSALGWLFRRTGQFARGATAGNRCI